MTPFEFQAELTRQWLDLTFGMTSATVAIATAAGQQALKTWTGAQSGTGTRVAPSLAFGMGQTFPPTPWAALFAGSSLPNSAFGFALPMPAVLSWWGSGVPGHSDGTFANPWAAPAKHPDIGPIAQVATSYRSATGFAVATVVGPPGVAFEQRKFGEPWWQAPPRGKPPF